jgi:uncharacterized protein
LAAVVLTPNFKTYFERLGQWVPVRLVCYALGALVVVVIATVLTRLLVPPAPSSWHRLVLIKNLLLPVALFAIYARLVQVLEHRRAQEIDTRRGLLLFLPGACTGSVIMGLFFLSLWGIGLAHISSGTGVEGLAGELLTPLVTAAGEELLFRVILFRILEQMSGTTVAVLVSAAVFGLAHAANPGATPFAIAALSIDMGVVLALAYVLTRNVWFAIGIHMSWNFTEGYVLGAYDSGLRDPHSLFLTTLSGSDLLTGGSFGPEGSIVMLGLGIAASAILVGLIMRRGQWQAPRFRLRLQTE